MRRVVFGGTFDPPHVAHLVAAETAYRQLGADRVTFIPAGDPWQKSDRQVTAASERFEMTRLAVAGVDYFEADGREVDRNGPTYTFDTVMSFPGTDELVLVMGADSAAGLRTWHRWEEIVARATVAVVPRAGTGRSSVDQVVAAAVWLDMPELALSSTEIRRRIATGASARFLLPVPVWRHVVDHGLYIEHED
jgi:nicotinate-nucleotide adenylyltransferase